MNNMKKYKPLNINTEIGDKFIEKLINSDVLTINEKMYGTKFAVKYDGKQVYFYKNNGLITKIDRLVMKIYDKPIEHMNSIFEKIKNVISLDYKYCFEIFNRDLPKNLLYDNNLINNMYISHIIDPFDNVITDISILNNCAEIFNVSEPPIIYQGKLTDKDIDSIITYCTVNDPMEPVAWSSRSFVTFIINLLRPDLYDKIFSSDVQQDFDNIYFTLQNDNSKYSAKLLSSKIDNDINNKQTNVEPVKNDILSLIYADIINFIYTNMSEIDKFLFNFESSDERYIDLMSHLFNLYYKENYEKYFNITHELPKFAKSSEFELNIEYMTNNQSLLYTKDSDDAMQLFKIFIVLFKKKQKNEEFLSSIMIKYQNELYDIIWKKIGNKDIHSLSKNIDINEQKNADEIEIDNSIHTLKIISFWQHLLEPIKKEDVRKNAANILIGDFLLLPKEIETYLNENIILFCIRHNHKFSDETETVLNELDNKHIKKVIYSETLDISRIITELERINIENIYCEETYVSELKLQLNFYKYKSNKKFNIPNIKAISLQKNLDYILNSINTDDYNTFKTLTMSNIHQWFLTLSKK